MKLSAFWERSRGLAGGSSGCRPSNSGSELRHPAAHRGGRKAVKHLGLLSILAAALVNLVVLPLAAEDTLPPVEGATANEFPPVAGDAPAPGNAPAAGATFQPGDIAVSGFAGTKLQNESLAPGVDPVSKTVIDTDGVTLRIYDAVSQSTVLAGQFVHPSTNFQAKAQDIGHVFALIFDKPLDSAGATPDLYAAASSAFGIQIMGPDRDGDGKPDRLTKGAPDAMLMPGQFGGLPGSGPGTIYKIDGATGNIRVFANVSTDGKSNPGPGLGGLAVDPASRTLYVSDLDTGLIHALSLASPTTDIAVFDHGVDGRPLMQKPPVPDDGKRMDMTSPDFDSTKPESWGFTPAERRIDALAVHSGRLYYAVADGPQIWSIGLGPNGAFSGAPHLETAVESERPYPVKSIVFDGGGHMILAQRGDVASPQDYSHFVDAGPSQVLRYTPQSDATAGPALWTAEPQEYATGEAPDHRVSNGGLALQYAYKPDGSIDLASCYGKIVVSADALGSNRAAHGLQINDTGLVLPGYVPPSQSVFVNWDERQDDAQARGLVGGVAVLQDCSARNFPAVAEGAPPVAGESGVPILPPVAGEGGPANLPPVAEQEGGGGNTQFPDVEGGTTNGSIVVRKTASAAKCSPDGGCAFTIEVSNPTGVDVPGPIVIDEQIDAPQATLTGLPAAPWTCTEAAPFTCTHPGPVPANGKLEDLQLTFAPNTPPVVKEVKNCALVQGGPAANPGAPPAPADIGPQLPPPPPPTGTNNGGLKVEKRGIPATCSPAAGTCEFEVKLTNTLAQPVTGPLKIFDTLTVGTQTQAKNNATSMQLPAGLTCKPEGREFNCSQDLLTLAPNASVSFRASFSIDTSEGGPAGFVTNKAVVTFGPLSGEASASIAFDKPVNVVLPEPVPGDQANAGGGAGAPAPSCATIPLDPNAPAQTGPITTKKTGPAKCAPNGPCAFTIAVTNTTDAEIKGPIVINDQIDAPQAALSGEPNAPWTCTKAAPFSCTHPGPLAAKQSINLQLSFTPNTPADVKQLRNCAVPVQPGAPAGAQPEAPAADQCATVGLDPNAKPQPGPEAQQLVLAKNPVAASCSETGGGCEFRISITNPGPNEFNGPLSFTDHVSAPDGSPFPNITLENVPQSNSVEGVVAPVFCKKDGNDVNCASAVPAKIPAGKTIEITMVFKPGSGSVATAIKNCASFAGGEKQCATIPLVKGPLLRAEKFTAAQTCVPQCAFAINLKNVGNDVAHGPFVVSEDFTPMGLGTTISVIDGDFACNQIGNKVGCISTNKGTDLLKPGESISGRILVKGALLSKEYRNCVSFNPAAQANPAPFDNDAPRRCVTVPEKMADRPSLRVSKVLSDPKDPANPGKGGTCKIDGPCRFQITVTNESDKDYTGPITINDEIPAKDTVGKPQAQPAGIENFADPDWNCTKTSTRGISCSNKKQFLAAHQAITLTVIGTPGPGWKKNDGFQNCANLVVSDQAFGTGRQSCAQYILDPFNVKVSKTGDQSCSPGGECHFTLTLFNPGPVDHNAPVTISDKLTELSSAQIVSINPPLPCATQPTQVPFSCTSPGPVSLPLGGAPQVFNMVIRLPNDASAAQFSNCASVSDETRSSESESSCATVATKPAPVSASAISVSKEALSSACDETSPCTFVVTLSNSMDRDIAGPISFNDVMSAGNQAMSQLTLAQAPASPWTCIASAAPGMQCSHPGPLPANGTLSLTLVMQPLAGSLTDATEITNCAIYRGARREPACVTLPVRRPPPASRPLPATPALRRPPNATAA